MSSKLLVLCAVVSSATVAVADTIRTDTHGEVIVIHDPPGKAVMPKPVKDPTILPPYSDRAIESDTWAKAWMLLDIDERGTVVRVKFLHRPGSDLDQIALDQAFKTRFEPARDQWNHPARSRLVWPIEWPSYGWMVARVGTVTRMPKWDQFSKYEYGSIDPNAVPCRGSGPLHIRSIHPVYRDCSVPDLSKITGTEPWLVAPAR